MNRSSLLLPRGTSLFLLAALTLLGCSSSSDKEEIPEYKLAGSLSQDLELPAGLALTGKQTHMQVPMPVCW